VGPVRLPEELVERVLLLFLLELAD
jgi:hypothetical protein